MTARSARVPTAPRAAAPVASALDRRMVQMLALRPGPIWRFITSQGPAFWAILFYVFIEYVRPQQLNTSLAVVPWGKISLGLAAVTYLGSGKLFQTRHTLNALLLLYGAVIIASSVQAYNPSDSTAAWWLFFSWVVIYFLIINIVNTEERFAVFLMSWMLWNFYMSQGAAKQWAGRGFSFANWGIVGAPGWFHNSGEFGIEMCVFLPISWHFYLAAKPHLNKWWKKGALLLLPVTALMGIIASSSRGALLGVGCIGLWMLARSKQRLKAIVGVAVLGTVVFVATPEEQKQRFSEAGSDSTSSRRLTYWKAGVAMANSHPALGIGYGNWLTYYKDNFVDYSAGVDVSGALGAAQLSHNIFVECMAELGYIGLICFVVLIVGTFVTNHGTRKMARAGPDPSPFIEQMAYGFDGALIGFLASGFFVTVLYYPFFWINLAFTVALRQAVKHRARRARTMAATAARPPVPRATLPPPLPGLS